MDAVILTHNHVDHVYGVPSLLHQLWLTGRTEPLVIYAPKTVCPLVEEMVSLFQFRAKKNFFPLSVKTVEDQTFGDLSLSFFPTDHTDDSIGLLAEAEGKRILYTADTRPIGEPKRNG